MVFLWAFFLKKVVSTLQAERFCVDVQKKTGRSSDPAGLWGVVNEFLLAFA
jgi:hypothetical protein